jgi:hypothetical protein
VKVIELAAVAIIGVINKASASTVAARVGSVFN